MTFVLKPDLNTTNWSFNKAFLQNPSRVEAESPISSYLTMMACLVSRLASPFQFLFISRSCRQPVEYFMLQRVSSGIFNVYSISFVLYIYQKSDEGYLVTLSANLTQFCLTSETRLCADIIKAGHYHWDYEGLYLSLIMKTLTRITTTTKLKRRITTQTDLKIFLHNFCFFLLRAIWSP